LKKIWSEFLKRWIDASRNHQYFVSKNAEFLEQSKNLHIKGTAKLNEMPCTSDTSGRQKVAFEDSSEKGAENQGALKNCWLF
jgi:hypothetical protein